MLILVNLGWYLLIMNDHGWSWLSDIDWSLIISVDPVWSWWSCWTLDDFDWSLILFFILVDKFDVDRYWLSLVDIGLSRLYFVYPWGSWVILFDLCWSLLIMVDYGWWLLLFLSWFILVDIDCLGWYWLILFFIPVDLGGSWYLDWLWLILVT